MDTAPQLRSVTVPSAVPPLLSVAAGYVDACTFLALFGLFVAQLTGSYVVAGALLVGHDQAQFLNVLAIPAFFVAGVLTTMLSVLVARRGRMPLPWVLASETVLLIAFMLAALLGSPLNDPSKPAVLIVGLLGLTAMGVQSALVRLLMNGVPSTNVMTNNTTQLAIDFAEVLLSKWEPRLVAEPEMQAARERLRSVLPIAGGFLLGTVTGAVAYAVAGLICLVAPIAVTGGLWIWALRRREATTRAD